MIGVIIGKINVNNIQIALVLLSNLGLENNLKRYNKINEMIDNKIRNGK